MVTCPAATTGTYALLSHPRFKNPYSNAAASSRSVAHRLPITSVKALPEAWPARRIFAISASLLSARSSLTSGFSGKTLAEARRPANPEEGGVGGCRKRERSELEVGLSGISV